MKEVILVTGASGFIGKHLIQKLLKYSYKIICLDLVFDNNFVSEFDGKLEMITGNLMDISFIMTIIQKHSPDYVFHLAGLKNRTNSLPEFKSSNDINYLVTLKLFETLLECQNLKLVTILGTIEEYGSANSPFNEETQELPNSAYGLSKLSATKLALIFHHQFNLPVVIMRPSIAYGPGQGEEMFIPALVKTLIGKNAFKMTEGKQLRDFIYIDDLTDALIKVINNNKIKGQVLNIASGTSVRIKDIALQIAEITNSVEFLKLGEIPYRGSEIMNYTVNISKALSLLQWYPKTNLNSGLGKTISYYKNELL